MIRARVATVPEGAFITALGDWNIKQFAEKRLPTLAELTPGRRRIRCR